MKTFEKFGIIWNEHVPGDVMPVAERVRVVFLMRGDEEVPNKEFPSVAKHLSWEAMPEWPESEIIGWIEV